MKYIDVGQSQIPTPEGTPRSEESYLVLSRDERGRPIYEKVLHRTITQDTEIHGHEIQEAFEQLEATVVAFSRMTLRDLVVFNPAAPAAYEYLSFKGKVIDRYHVVNNGDGATVNVAQSVPVSQVYLPLRPGVEMYYSVQGQIHQYEQDYDVSSTYHPELELLEKSRQAANEVKTVAILPTPRRRLFGRGVLNTG